MKLTSSPWLFFRTVLGGLIATILIAYLWQGYVDNHWWSPGYFYSFIIPVIFIVAVSWLAFVPAKFDLSDGSLRIQFAFRPDHEIDWNELRFGGRTFQIALFAFPRSQRRQLIDFLSSHFPERRARGWLGIWGFR
jgi:hypothetical protein